MSAMLVCGRLRGRPVSATPCCLCDNSRVNVLLPDGARELVMGHKRGRTASILAVGCRFDEGCFGFRSDGDLTRACDSKSTEETYVAEGLQIPNDLRRFRERPISRIAQYVLTKA